MTTTEPAPAPSTARTPQRPVKAAADELIDVSFTVNGTPVTLSVPARMHLADALRGHLGLSGTHLGCEHGVCGMCTVLIDGDAARACLVFAVQAEGTAVVTVEGLGTPDDQHPLQQAFSHHHALQCGFCTPGFLLSSYDLLANGDRPVDPETLPEEMSGVICRCTGYRGILAAVTDVAEAYPDGLPEPMNCAPRTLVGRGGAAQTSGAGPDDAAATEDDAGQSPAQLTRPTGTPTITVQVTRRLTSPVEDVWAVMDDVDRLARCLPGAEMTADLGDDHYRGRAKVALGPVRLAFEGLARITERDRDRHALQILAQGADTGGNRTAAEIGLRATAADGGTELVADAAVFLSGRIAQFGRALAGDVSQRMFEQFADAVDRTAQTGEAPEVGSGPSPLAIGVQAVVAGVRRRVAAVRTAARDRLRARRGR